MPDISRFFPPQDVSNSTARPPPTPESYLSQVASIVSPLYEKLPVVETDDDLSGPTALASVLPDKASHEPPHALIASLPPPIRRLLTVLASHLTPAPCALPAHLRGAAPQDSVDGVLNLLPFVDQLEQVLLQGGGAAKAAKEGIDEARAKAAEERKRRKVAEIKRRRDLEQVRKDWQGKGKGKLLKATIDDDGDTGMQVKRRVKSKEWISDSDEDAGDGEESREHSVAAGEGLSGPNEEDDEGTESGSASTAGSEA